MCDTPYLKLEVSAFDSPFLKETNTGLGNVLFQIATTYALCKKYDFQPDFSHIFAFGKKLRNLYGLDHDEKIFSRLPKAPEEGTVHYTVRLNGGGGGKEGYNHDFIKNIVRHRNNNSNIIICGYLEDDTYFYQYADDIRKLLCPPADFSLKDLCPPGRIPVSIHVRGNEFIKYTYVEYNKSSLFEKDFMGTYLVNAIEYIIDNVPGAYFLIFTDDPNVIDINAIPRIMDRGYRFVNGFKDYEDMWLMSLCAHNITGLSTFGWWGTWLAGNDGRIRTFDFLNVRQRHMKNSFIAL